MRKKAQEFFKRNKKVKCPAFPNEYVIFNSKGLNHLFYKCPRSGRNEKEIKTRVSLLPSTLKIISKMPYPQEESSYISKGTKYRFWAFEAVVDQKRVKVIVRQIGKGKKHFWSVIPAWRKTKFGRVNAKSNLGKQ